MEYADGGDLAVYISLLRDSSKGKKRRVSDLMKTLYGR